MGLLLRFFAFLFFFFLFYSPTINLNPLSPFLPLSFLTLPQRWLNHDDLGFLQAMGMMGGGGHNHGQGGQGGHGGHGHSHGGQGGGHDHGALENKPSHPISPSEITSEWLNQALGKGGHLKSATVCAKKGCLLPFFSTSLPPPHFFFLSGQIFHNKRRRSSQWHRACCPPQD